MPQRTIANLRATLRSNAARAVFFFFKQKTAYEIYFVHAGRGRFETDYGVLAYEPGDYIVIPKGTTYRLVLESDKSSLFVIVKTTAPVELPDRGSLGHHALFDKGVLVAPELPPQASDDR